MRWRGGPVSAMAILAVLLLTMLPGSVAARDAEPLVMVTQVSVGTDHTCALWWDGLSCWGDNDDGMLGNGTRSGSFAAPVAPPMIEPLSVVVPRESTAVRPFGTVQAGPDNTCAIATGQGGTVAGSLWCWGANPYGRVCVFGDAGGPSDPTMVMAGPPGPEGTPAQCGTPLSRVIRAAVGQDGGCALVQAAEGELGGEPWCWGPGGQAAILAHPLVPGDGATRTVLVDIDVSLDRYCGLESTGQVWCWTGSSGVPERIVGLAPAVAIAVGNDHACAQVEDGGIWCWGANTVGQLGDGTTTASEAPVQVVGLGETEPAVVPPPDLLPTGTRILDAGEGLTCVLRGSVAESPRAATSAWCWGAGNRGQLGDGSRDRRTGPVQVTGLDGTDGLVDLSVGGSTACAATLEEVRWSGNDPTWGGFVGSQGLRCWGANDRGQLGVGDWDDRSSPTLVVMTGEPRFRE